MGAACSAASMVEELKHNGPPLLLMDNIGSDELFSASKEKSTFLFDSRELRIYNLSEQLQYSMTKAGRILNSSGSGCVQLQREIGADSKTIFVACTGQAGQGFRQRKLAVHSSNVRQAHMVHQEVTATDDEDDIKNKELGGSDPLLLDGTPSLQLTYAGGNFAPSCCNCCSGGRKKIYAGINRPSDEMCLWFFPEGANPTVIAVFSKSIGQIYHDRFAANPTIDMDTMYGLRVAPKVEHLLVFTILFLYFKSRSRDPWG